MAAYNALNDFKSEYKLQQRMQLLTDTLTALQGPNGQPLIPNNEGTPLHNLIRQLNLQPAAAPEPYDFELHAHVTIDQIQNECNNRNICIFDVTRNLGNRAYYNTTYGQPPAAGQPVNHNPWREYSRPEAAEKAVEMSLVTCYGDSTTIVNWAETLPKLKELFKARVYTNAMAKTALMNMVHKYHPEQAILLRTQTANEIATHLLQLDSNRDKRTYHRMQLFKIVRTPEEDLPVALAKAQLLIDAIYPLNDPAFAAHRSSTFRTALISFCHDTVAAGVLEQIQHHQTECLPLTDDQIRDYAVKYENHTHLKPTTNLTFGRVINSVPAATFIQLNSTRVAANTIYPAYPAYPSPYANPYPAYPYYEDALELQNLNALQNQAQPQGQPQVGQNPLVPGQVPNLAIPAAELIQQPAFLQPQVEAPANLQAQVPIGPQVMPQAQPWQQWLARAGLPQFPATQALPRQRPVLQPPRLNPAIPLPYQVNPAMPVGQQAPQATLPQSVAIPDQEWLENLPQALKEIRSPDQTFHTPATSPESTPHGTPLKTPQRGATALPTHVSGNQAAWNLPYIATPEKTVDFRELPTDSPVFVQSQRRLARINDEIVLVKNHPEDVIPANLLDRFQSMDLTTGNAGSKSKIPKRQKSSDGPIRTSSRSRKQTEFFQAGLNSIIPTRGYVDQTGRYRSHSRENPTSRPSSQMSDSRPNSRNDSRSRVQTPSGDRSRYNSNDRNRSNERSYRTQPNSDSRSKSPSYSSNTRPGRSPYKSTFRSSDRSSSTRRIYPLMQKGLNCRPDYNPHTTKHCMKCMKNGHHEFECAKYYVYSDTKCTFCNKMHHKPQDCKEIKEFPPGTKPKNN